MSSAPPPGQPPVFTGPMMPPPPPGAYGPPPMYMMPPPPPPRQGGGFVRAIFVTLASTIFGASLLLNLYLLAMVGLTNSNADPNELRTSSKTLVAGDSSQRISIVRFDGTIDEGAKRSFNLLIDHVERDANTKALVIEVDSPGGGVTASDEIYDRLMKFKSSRKIPIVISMGSLAASGGYYISMAGDEVIAQETTITGSIGVLMPRIDLSGFGEKYGIKDGSVIADGATFKNAGSMTKPLTKDEEAYFKSILNDAFDTFKDRIAKGRPKLTPQQIEAAANGKIFTGKQALAMGLVDKLGYLDDAINAAASRAGLSKPQAVRVERELGLLEQLAGNRAESQGKAAAAITVNGVSVSSSLLDRYASPRPLYMMP